MHLLPADGDGAEGGLRSGAGIMLAGFAGSLGLPDRLDVPIAMELGDSKVIGQA